MEAKECLELDEVAGDLATSLQGATAIAAIVVNEVNTEEIIGASNLFVGCVCLLRYVLVRLMT